MWTRVLQTSVLSALVALPGGCADQTAWPPAPRNKQESLMIDSTVRAVSQIDGWTQVACVVERQKNQWRVQAWRIVNPKARGRDKCVPWAVRSITLNDDAKVLDYKNHL
jgi:hypothetical protein